MVKLSAANQQLADLLVIQEILTESELQQILVQHSLIGGRLADFLIDTTIVPEASLLRLYERVFAYPIANFAMLEQIQTSVARLIPANLAQLQMLIPFKQVGTAIHVAFLEPPDLEALGSMKGFAEQEVLIYLAPREMIRWAIAKHYPELFITPENPIFLHDPFENRIGHRLIAEGLLTQQQLEEALLERTPGKAGRTGELLMRMGYIAEDDLYRSLAAQTKIPFVKMPPEYSIQKTAATLFSKTDAMQWQSVPVLEDETSITILTSEPNALPELIAMFDRQVKLMLSTPTQIKTLTQQLSDHNHPIIRMLIQQGHLRLEQRAIAVQQAFESGLEITEVLADLGFVSPEIMQQTQLALPSEQVIPTEEPWELSFSGRLAHNLAAQLGVTYIDPTENPPDMNLRHLIPEKIMRQYSLFPYQKTSSGLSVLMTDPRNIFAINDLEALLEQEIEPIMADRLEIERLIETISPQEPLETPIPEETLETTIRRLIREELEDFRLQLLFDLRASSKPLESHITQAA